MKRQNVLDDQAIKGIVQSILKQVEYASDFFIESGKMGKDPFDHIRIAIDMVEQASSSMQVIKGLVKSGNINEVIDMMTPKKPARPELH